MEISNIRAPLEMNSKWRSVENKLKKSYTFSRYSLYRLKPVLISADKTSQYNPKQIRAYSFSQIQCPMQKKHEEIVIPSWIPQN